MDTDLEKITPPKHFSSTQKSLVFQHFYRKLARYRNTLLMYAVMECSMSEDEHKAIARQRNVEKDVKDWAQGLLAKAWIVCFDREETNCPTLDPQADTSTIGLAAPSPNTDFHKLINAILFLDITSSKQYSARTRTFLSSLCPLEEFAISSTLQNPTNALEEVRKKTSISTILDDHAERNTDFRFAGAALGALAGGVLIGLTGGLAAPLVGAGVGAVLGIFGIGGSLLGLLATGLAGSSVVCAALFGVYGANESKRMVERHMKEVKDLEIVDVNVGRQERLGVNLCVSGWLNDREDVTVPWKVFDGNRNDTFALQWEVENLKKLSNALKTLIQSEAMGYVSGQILRRTILAGIMSSLAPLALLRIGQIIDNPWMNARALALKTGAVLADLLSQHVFGNRPVTLVGYSLGALVIFEALLHLATLPPAQIAHLIQDVYLFGTPVSTHPTQWTAVRRVAAGRVLNGYSTRDWVLGVVCRISEATIDVAGIQSVDHVKGIENVCCDEDVEGHTQWKNVIAKRVPDCCHVNRRD